MLPEQQISEFLSRLRAFAGENLESLILYGSAADGEFHPEFSDVNLLCLLRDASYASLVRIAPAIEWWHGRKHPNPLLLTREELVGGADIFSIEMLDIHQHHRVLFGPDPFASLQIPLALHRAQVEYELRQKLILLRNHLLAAAGNEKRLWELLLRSVSTFTTLFRHALMVLGEPVPPAKREVLRALAARGGFDLTAFSVLLDLREKKAERKDFEVGQLFTSYLAAVQQVTAAVDQAPEPAGS